MPQLTARPTRLLNLIGDGFCQLGEDATVLPYLQQAAMGVSHGILHQPYVQNYTRHGLKEMIRTEPLLFINSYAPA